MTSKALTENSFPSMTSKVLLHKVPHSCTVRVPEPLVRVPVPFVPVLVPVRGTAGTAGRRGGWRVPHRPIFTANIKMIKLSNYIYYVMMKPSRNIAL
jgi:hypothetical protein